MGRLASDAWKHLRLPVVLMVVSAFLFLMPSRFTAPARVLFQEAAGPVQTAAFQGAGDALATGGTLTEMFSQRDRERALAREVTRLRSENVELDERLRRQGRALQSVAALAVAEGDFHAVRAMVSAYDTTATRRSISIRAGTRQGVAPGMAVTADGALVGVVVESGRRQSRVRLITDAESVIPCRVAGTGALCVLQGTGGDECDVDWLDRDSFVESGDAVVTASLDSVSGGVLKLPDGVPAVTVTSVETDPLRPLFKDVAARPRVNLRRLEGVEVLVPSDRSPVTSDQ